MKRFFSLFMGFVMLLNMAQAEEITYDFSTSIPSVWTSNPAPRGFEANNYERGAQFQKSTKLTLSGAKGISKVVVICSSNDADSKNSISVSVNGTQFGKVEMLAKENNVEKTFEGEATDGDLVINIAYSKKSVWIKQVVVTCSEGVANVDDDETGKTLDPDFVYGDSVKIIAPDDEFFKEACTFVQNNVEVKCSKSTHKDGYFSCLAGERITFTATQPIVAIAINGTVKKNFEAEASAGNLYAAYDSFDEVTHNPVLVIDEINDKSVTISCKVQLQCTEVTLYFKEAPKWDFETLFEGEEEEVYTYENESQEPKTWDLAFDEARYTAYSEENGLPFIQLFFGTPKEYLYLEAYANYDEETGIAPGTYPIDNEVALGHVIASPGVDSWLIENPSYLTTDYEETEEDYTYNIFFIVSGTLTVARDEMGVKMELDAKSYYGSTIHATYVGPIYNTQGGVVDGIDNLSVAPAKANQGKYIRNGQFCIERNGRKYNALGVSIR